MAFAWQRHIKKHIRIFLSCLSVTPTLIDLLFAIPIYRSFALIAVVVKDECVAMIPYTKPVPLWRSNFLPRRGRSSVRLEKAGPPDCWLPVSSASPPPLPASRSRPRREGGDTTCHTYMHMSMFYRCQTYTFLPATRVCGLRFIASRRVRGGSSDFLRGLVLPSLSVSPSSPPNKASKRLLENVDITAKASE